MDSINPSYYVRNGVECVDVVRTMIDGQDVTQMEAYWWATSIKYLWRWKEKNGTEDLRKCQTCIGFLIEECKRVSKS